MSISALELLHIAVRNIPKFRDSCDVIELLLSRKMEDKTRLFRGSQAYLEEAYAIFFKSVAYQKPYWKCLVKYSAHFVAYFAF